MEEKNSNRVEPEELKIHEDGSFDIEIISVDRVGEGLKIKVETPFGKENIGLGKQARYKDTLGKPKWKKQVKKLLKKKYGEWVEEKQKMSSEPEPEISAREEIGLKNIEEL